MKRKVYEKLLEWKSQEHHKPLILNGVRQCGKTYVLKEFGRQEFDSLAYVSCDRNVNLQAIYSGDFDVARIIQGFANSTSKCKITKCFCKSTPLVLRNSISFLVSH